MNREVKFRVFHDAVGRMEPWGLICHDYTLGSLFVDVSHHVHVMQYTGLKDKNGNEIYESDVCKWTNKTSGISGIGVIKYSDQGARFQINDGDVRYQLNPAFITLEVLGNIYENPELIQKA